MTEQNILAISKWSTRFKEELLRGNSVYNTKTTAYDCLNKKIIFFFQAIVNDDVRIIDGYCPYNSSCSMKNLSCRYLDNLNNHTIKEYYANLTDALKAVEDGEAWGALYFNENYTDSLVARLALGELFATIDNGRHLNVT